MLYTALHHPFVEAAEPDDSEYTDTTHCRVALYTSVVTIAAGPIGELGDPGHIGSRTSRTHRRTRISRTHQRTRISRTHRN